MIKRSSEEIVNAYYLNHHSTVHASGCLGQANGRIHWALERQRNGGDYPVTIELGAGNFEHTVHVQHDWRTYIATDIRTPPLKRVVDLTSKFADREFVFLNANALNLPFPDGFADRVVAGCLMIHLVDPMEAIGEWQRVCSRNGVIDFLVPCDPGIALRLFRRLVSEREAARYGVSPMEYRIVNAIEHLSPFSRVLAMTRASIEPERTLKVKYFPLPWLPFWNLNAFAVFSIGPRATST